MAISQFLWARSHYDVIVTSYINGLYLFWYQWKEDVHTYTRFSHYRVAPGDRIRRPEQPN